MQEIRSTLVKTLLRIFLFFCVEEQRSVAVGREECGTNTGLLFFWCWYIFCVILGVNIPGLFFSVFLFYYLVPMMECAKPI